MSFITVTAPNSCPFAFNASGAVVQHDDTSSDVGDPKVRLIALALPFQHRTRTELTVFQELAKILEAATH